MGKSWREVRFKREFIWKAVDIGILLAFLGMCFLLNHIYLTSGDWNRTLGHNYDFLGKNREIHDLYIGAASAETTEGLTYTGSAGESCNLRSPEQSLSDSYYLLRRADKRYALSHIYLQLPFTEVSGREDDENASGGKEYLQKIVTYCEEKKLELTVLE